MRVEMLAAVLVATNLADVPDALFGFQVVPHMNATVSRQVAQSELSAELPG